MRVKLSVLLRCTSITLICIYLYFYQLFEAVGLKMIGLSMLGIALLFNIGASFIRLRLRIPMMQRVLWLYFLFVLIFYNEYIARGNYGTVLMPVTALSVVLLYSDRKEWIGFAYKMLIMFGMVHVCATLLFAISNSLYRATMPKLWGYFPVGTMGGTKGAAAGLTRHYSYNGIYCSVVFLFSASALVTRAVTRKRDLKRYYAIAILSFVAVILTQKRAHLLFSLAAIVGLYLVCSYYKGLKKIGKIIVVAVCAAVLLGIAALFVPSTLSVFERFIVTGDTDISTGRFAVWAVGIEMFRQSPIFGNGWFYFPVSYSRAEFTEIHNIYIQFLCELGVVGTIMMVSAMFSSVYVCVRTFKRYRNHMPKETLIPLSASIGYQFFIVLYGLTGCCLTDITVVAYMLSMGIGLAICCAQRMVRKRKV